MGVQHQDLVHQSPTVVVQKPPECADGGLGRESATPSNQETYHGPPRTASKRNRQVHKGWERTKDGT